MLYKKLGKRIQEERLYLRLTQSQLAEDIDISDTYDYLLSDTVSTTDSIIFEQFNQIIDDQPIEHKQMAINVLRAVFAYFEDDRK